MTPSFAVILGYVALQLVIAWLVSRRISGEDDYLVAGRSLGPILCTFSIFVTWFGAETCVAAAAQRGTLAGGLLFLGFGTLVALLGVAASTMDLEGAEHSEQILLTLAAAQLGPLWATLFSGALVAAILSTVDSALLTAGSLAAHNIIIPMRPPMSDRARLRLNRLSVVGFGIIACFLANKFDSVYELIEQSSAFASAGVVVVTPIALFTRFGGPSAAISSLLAGAAFYCYGAYFAEWSYPYLTAVTAASSAYTGVALLDRNHSTANSHGG